MKKLFTTLIVLLSVALNLQAQDVYISPTTGHLIAAVTGDNETGFQNGFSSLWRHNQLGLTMVVADGSELTTGNEIANPAGNLNIVNGRLTLTGGQPSDCFVVVSLPKGYRFTSYTLDLNNDMNGYSYSRNFKTGSVSKWFYETGSDFGYSSPKATASNSSGATEMSSSNNNDDYTITRTADDMGNRLYFRLHKTVTNQYFSVSIKSFVVHFAADEPFDQPLQALPTATAVGVEKSPFMVGKPELGTIKPNTKDGKTYFSYDYRNVDDLEADNLLYQLNAVVDGKADDSNVTTKTITRTIVNDEPWFALAQSSDAADNTYFVETPVTLTSESGHEFPTGYRITGAKFEFSRGTATSGGKTVGINRHGEITYLQSNGSVAADKPVTGWQVSNGRLTLNGSRIYVARNRNNNFYYLTTNSSNTVQATFRVNNENKIYAQVSNGWFSGTTTMYIHEGDLAGEQAVLSSSTDDAAQLMDYSAFTPSSSGFTAKVFGKTGKDDDTDNQTINVTTDETQTVTITGLNNDAVKFQISGLAAGSQALVRITLTMQHLNPYIHSLEITATDKTDNTKTVGAQTFTANNFSVRGGKFEFNVPEGTRDHEWAFTFDKLTSNYTDETYAKISGYGGQTNGHARIAFVESEYFTSDKGKSLYATTYDPDADPITKVKVEMVGTVPFRFNNADELSNESESTVESQLEEYAFSVEQYQKDTGYKDENGDPIKGSFAQLELGTVNGKTLYEDVAYIIVSDETRYNIAPTTATEHRYYAHYDMDIEIEEKEFTMTLEPVKVYESTFYTDREGNEKDDSMWGIKVSTTEAGGYASLTNVLMKISQLCDKAENGLSDMSQILYVDMSGLSSIMLPSDQDQVAYLNAFRADMAPNCLVYLPNGIAYKADNYANKASSASSTYNSNANIVLHDKSPFFAPYAINTQNTNYALYTRRTTHTTTGKSNITSVVLPFKFTVASDGTGKHTNDGTGGDGKSFTVCKLASTNAVSQDQGDKTDETFKDFNNRMVVNFNNYVHFEKFKPATGTTTDAYKPYLIYISDDQQLDGDDNFAIMEYGASIEATPKADGSTTAGKIKIADTSTNTGKLDGTDLTLTPNVTMAGCKLAKNDEPCLYFSADRFRNSTTLTTQYPNVLTYPFRSWFAYPKSSSAKDNYYGIAFGFGDTTTGIDGINTDKQQGTYKFILNGKLYIHTDKGTFTEGGQKVNL